MISFSRKVKEEIVFNEFEECCKKAILLALLKLNGAMSITSDGLGITMRTENAKVASFAHHLLKDIYNPRIEFLVQKKIKLKKNNVYIVRISKAREILDDLKLFTQEVPTSDDLPKQCCRRAYLAGAFLATGSVNAPTSSNYHLEISTQNEAICNFICNLMNGFALHAKSIERRGKHIIYIKSAERISDFLRIIGSSKCMLDFENERIDRDYLNSINRWDNCVIANEMKSYQASKGQVDDITLLKEHFMFNDLDEKTQIIATLRLENPDATLIELADIYSQKTGHPISKSGINHQLKKIKDKASQLRVMEGER